MSRSFKVFIFFSCSSLAFSICCQCRERPDIGWVRRGQSPDAWSASSLFRNIFFDIILAAWSEGQPPDIWIQVQILVFWVWVWRAVCSWLPHGPSPCNASNSYLAWWNILEWYFPSVYSWWTEEHQHQVSISMCGWPYHFWYGAPPCRSVPPLTAPSLYRPFTVGSFPGSRSGCMMFWRVTVDVSFPADHPQTCLLYLDHKTPSSALASVALNTS